MKYSKVLILLGIGCCVGFLLIFGVDLQWGNLSKVDTGNVNMKESKAQVKLTATDYQSRKQVSNSVPNDEKSNGNSEFYQAIVDNSLFRPLGWKPPNNEPEYTLIGTAIDTIGDNSKAFVLENRSNQFYTVSVGHEIGDAVVKEIEDKKAILYKNGEMITLKSDSMRFLKSGNNSSREITFSRNGRDSGTDKSSQRGTRSKSTNVTIDKKKIAELMKNSKRDMKNVMKEAVKIEKEMGKFNIKSAADKSKILSIDLELKMKSKD